MLSLVQLLPPETRAYELNHSAFSVLNYSLTICEILVPEVAKSEGGNIQFEIFIEFCLRCLDFTVEASRSQSCQESRSMSLVVSATLQMFSQWYSRQVHRKTNSPTDATTLVLDKEYRSLLQQFVSTCLSHSHYNSLLHDAVNCKVGDVVRSVLECGGERLINTFDMCGRRPLHVAVQSGNPELVSLFLEFGAHVDAVNREGSSAAEVVGHNNTAIIQRILSDLLPYPLTCQASQTVLATEFHMNCLTCHCTLRTTSDFMINMQVSEPTIESYVSCMHTYMPEFSI